MSDNADAQSKAAGQESEDRLGRLEALLMQGMAGIAASVNELKTGASQPAPAPAGMGLADQNFGQRLSMLEESFARMCMVVGRLDQQMQQLLDAAEKNDS